MPKKHRPEVGLWYQEKDTGDQFEVVAIDELTGTIETQNANGEVDELEQDSWYKLNLQAIEAPEYWSKDFEDLDSFDSADIEFEENDNYGTEPWFGSLNNISDEGFEMDREW